MSTWQTQEFTRRVTLNRSEIAKTIQLQDDLIRALDGSLSQTQLQTSLANAGVSLVEKIFDIAGSYITIAGLVISGFSSVASAQRNAIKDSVTNGRTWFIDLNRRMANNPSWVSLEVEAPFLKMTKFTTYESFTINHGPGVIRTVNTTNGSIPM